MIQQIQKLQDMLAYFHKGQSWGVLDSAVYVMSNRDRSDALESDVEKMASWYGYKDQNGVPFVGANWLKCINAFFRL